MGRDARTIDNVYPPGLPFESRHKGHTLQDSVDTLGQQCFLGLMQ